MFYDLPTTDGDFPELCNKLPEGIICFIPSTSPYFVIVLSQSLWISIGPITMNFNHHGKTHGTVPSVALINSGHLRMPCFSWWPLSTWSAFAIASVVHWRRLARLARHRGIVLKLVLKLPVVEASWKKQPHMVKLLYIYNYIHVYILYIYNNDTNLSWPYFDLNIYDHIIYHVHPFPDETGLPDSLDPPAMADHHTRWLTRPLATTYGVVWICMQYIYI